MAGSSLFKCYDSTKRPLFLLLHLLLAAAVTAASDGVNAGLVCDFEDSSCRWHWTRFQRKSAADINSTIYSSPDPAMVSGPLDDAEGRTSGNKTPIISIHLLVYSM